MDNPHDGYASHYAVLITHRMGNSDEIDYVFMNKSNDFVKNVMKTLDDLGYSSEITKTVCDSYFVTIKKK